MPRVLVAPDKFRGSASAREASDALVEGVRLAGWDVDQCPLSDGGDGFLDVMGGATHHSTVVGPLGSAVDVGWRLEDSTAIIESALACGAALVASPQPRDALAATTTGVGELIRAVIDAGATRIVIGVGGSASSDGGRGAIDALRGYLPFSPLIDVTVACDVDVTYLLAATVFSPQKGADAAAVTQLQERLKRYAGELRDTFGRDVLAVSAGGAAGGLAGGLWAGGARLVSGFALVSEHLSLRRRVEAADLVITGEGRFDATSLTGKVTGSVLALARECATPAVLVAGAVDGAISDDVIAADWWSLSELFGDDASRHDTTGCLRDVARQICARPPR